MRADAFDAGIITISIDTEVGWARINSGDFDNIEARLDEAEQGIRRLRRLLDRHEVPATWAVVGQLCRPCSSRESPFTGVDPTPDGTHIPWDREWWHARETIERIIDSSVDHEIGSHSGNHLLFDDCDRETASRDLESFFEWCDIVDRSDVRSFVYPQNRVGHTDLLAEMGFECYRSPPPRLGIEPTPTAFLPKLTDGLVSIPPSVSYRHYGGRHALLRRLPHGLKVTGMKAGVRHAALRSRVFHVVLHPNDFTGADGQTLLNGFDRWLEYVTYQRARSRVRTLTMGEVASRATF